MNTEPNPALLQGFNRFRFGFAQPGETHQFEGATDRIEFVGNFRRRRDAIAAAPTAQHRISPYLYGKLKRGWAVWRYLSTTTQTQTLAA